LIRITKIKRKMKKLLLVFALASLFSCGSDEEVTNYDLAPNCVWGVLKDGTKVYLGCATRRDLASGSRVLPESWFDSKYARRETKEVKNCSECQ
jgi:hypothetical protein